MSINSREKGKRGELEFAAYLRDQGVDARRGRQFSGGQDSPDVVTSLPGIHWEVKRVETGNPYSWMDQALRDAGPDRMPIVAHRRNRRDWIAVMRMDDLLSLLGEKQ